jgi:hypothetical protein
MMEDKFKRNNFPFGKKFKFQMYVLNQKSRKQNQFEFSLNFKEIQTFKENPINSPKFSLHMIFMNMNLD